jgi:hypothetical protein
MLQNFARQYLKDGLELLPSENLRMFALMYGRKNGARSVDDAVAMPLASIVDEMRPEQLDTAMDQLRRTLEKRNIPALEQNHG